MFRHTRNCFLALGFAPEMCACISIHKTVLGNYKKKTFEFVHKTLNWHVCQTTQDSNIKISLSPKDQTHVHMHVCVYTDTHTSCHISQNLCPSLWQPSLSLSLNPPVPLLPDGVLTVSPAILRGPDSGQQAPVGTAPHGDWMATALDARWLRL